MAPPSWIILSTTLRVSDTPLPNDLGLSLDVQAPPRVSFLTLAPRVSAKVSEPLIEALDPSGLLVVYTGPGVTNDTYCVLDVPAAKVSYRLPENPPTWDVEYTKIGVIADPAGAAGAFVLADFDFTCGYGGGDGEKNLVRYCSTTSEWCIELEHSPDEDPDEVPDRYWEFDDVVSHDGRIWWIDTNAGLVTCNAFRDEPPFRYVPLPDDDDDGRYVQLSDGKFRYIQIRTPEDAPTFVTMRTLIDPETAQWTDPEYELSFTDIRASDTFKAAGLPADKDPVFALIHPKNPDVLYFFLDDYLFAFDMFARKLIECQAHGLDDPSSDSVRAWELPPDYAAAIASAPAPAAVMSGQVYKAPVTRQVYRRRQRRSG